MAALYFCIFIYFLQLVEPIEKKVGPLSVSLDAVAADVVALKVATQEDTSSSAAIRLDRVETEYEAPFLKSPAFFRVC